MLAYALGVGISLVAAVALEFGGLWWAMPLAGALGGYYVKRGRAAFVAAGIGVCAAWAGFLVAAAATSPLGQLLGVFAGILGLGSFLAFVPVVLALLIAFLLGGLGGLSGALLSGIRRAT